jgi:two-component system CheB/CheR fusion protein
VLKKLLGEILPKQKKVKDYEVSHTFEKIGRKTIMLNARQIDSVQLIILAMEDVTERKNLELKLERYTKGLEDKVVDRTEELTNRLKELEAMNKTMVGRELKMVELKKEIKRLKEK